MFILVSLLKNVYFNFDRISYKHALEGFLWGKSGWILNQAAWHTHTIILKGEIKFLTNAVFIGSDVSTMAE